MKKLNIYKVSIIIACTLFVAFWFSPWLYGYLDSETQGILAWGGYKAAINLPGWFWNVFLFINIIAYIGMYLLRKAFRTLFLVLLILSLPLGSVGGLSVLTGIEVVIFEILNLLDGFILALAYFTELEEDFY